MLSKLSSPSLEHLFKGFKYCNFNFYAGLKIELIIPNCYMASACKYVEYSKTPQQVNGYDCGLYIAAIAKAICRWYERKSEPKDEDGLWFSTMNEQVNPSVVAEMCNEILGLVKSLMAMK